MKRLTLIVVLVLAVLAPPIGRAAAAGSLLDPSFRLDPAITGTIEVVRVRPDGRILIGGELTLTNGNPVSLLQLDSDGNIDPAFLARRTYRRVRDVLILPDGELLVAEFESLPSPNPWVETVTSLSSCFRVSADGSSWQPWADFPAEVRLKRLSKGNILATGTQTVVYSIGMESRGFVEGRLPDGTRDPGFRLRGVQLRRSPANLVRLEVLGMEECRNGDLLFCGFFEQNPERGGGMVALIRTRSDGEVIWTVPGGPLEFVYEDSLGRITAGGDLGMLRFDGNGLPDAAGYDSGAGIRSESPSLKLSDGRLLVWGRFPLGGPGQRQDLWSILDDGTLDLRFQPRALVEPSVPYGRVWSLAEQVDGKLLVSGQFQRSDGTTAPGLMRWFPQNPGAPAQTNAYQFRLVGLAAECGEAARIRLIRYGDTNRTDSFRVWTESSSAQGGVDFVPVDQTITFGMGERLKDVPLSILRNPELEGPEYFSVHWQPTDPETDWQGVSPLAVMIEDRDCRAWFVQPEASVVEGDAVVYHSQALVHVSNPSGLPVRVRSVDLTARAGIDYAPIDQVPGAFGTVELVTYDNAVADGDRQFALELFDAGAGLEMVSPNRILVTIRDNDIELGSWRGVSGSISAIHASTNRSWILAGDFDRVDGIPRAGLARYDRRGNLDLTFNPPSELAGREWTSASLPDGKVLVAGSIPASLDPAGLQIARLNSDGSPDTSFSLTGDWSPDLACAGGSNRVHALLAYPEGGFLVVGQLPRLSPCGQAGQYVRFSAEGRKMGQWSLGDGYGLPNEMQQFGSDSVLFRIDKHVMTLEGGGQWVTIFAPTGWEWPNSACTADGVQFWLSFGNELRRYNRRFLLGTVKQFTVGPLVLKAVEGLEVQAVANNRILIRGLFQAEGGSFGTGWGFVVVDTSGTPLGAAPFSFPGVIHQLGPIASQPSGEFAATSYYAGLGQRTGWIRLGPDLRPVSDLRLESFGLVSDQMQFRFAGQAPTGYAIESSVNLVDWETRLVSTNVNWGQVHVDPGLAGEGARFYRVRK